MRLLICGGRDFSDWESAGKVLDAMHGALQVDVVIHGAAKGADTIGRDWARRNGVPHESYPADWNRHGRGAGPIRNQQMLDEGKPSHVLAFPGGRGTADMVDRARRAGVQVIAAIADRNGNRRDRETGLGPKDESGGAGTAIAQPSVEPS